MLILHLVKIPYFSFWINSLHWFRGRLDMVGVVGSSPIAPTKQNPLCWAVWKGSPKGGPFFVVWCLGKHWEYFGQTTTGLHFQVGFDLHINHRVIAVPCLVVLGHLHVRVPHQALTVFLFETLLLVQPGTECADLVEVGVLGAQTSRGFAFCVLRAAGVVSV